MKTKSLILTLSLAVAAMTMSSCETRADGTKTFAGLDAKQGVALGLKTATTYFDERAKGKAMAAASAKGVVIVQAPETEPPQLPWWQRIAVSLF